MNEFVQRNASSVIGMLSGFDRLLFRGTLRRIATAAGLSSFLSYTGVLLKDFGDYSMELTERVKDAALAVAQETQRPVLYLPDPSVRKEDVAREIAKRDGIEPRHPRPAVQQRGPGQTRGPPPKRGSGTQTAPVACPRPDPQSAANPSVSSERQRPPDHHRAAGRRSSRHRHAGQGGMIRENGDEFSRTDYKE